MTVVLLLGHTLAAAQNRAPALPLAVLKGKTASGLLVNQVLPDYPAVAKVNYIQGQVRLQVVVNAQGRVGDVHVVHGHPFLAAAALKAIRNWVYHPFVDGGVAAPFLTFVDMNFSLRPRRIEQFPVQPERDLTRQVHPPEVLDKPDQTSPGGSVWLKVLVSDKGRVIDSLPVRGVQEGVDTARKNIENWRFRPARWGSLAVPWYTEVEVPVGAPSLPQSAGDPGGQ